MDDWTSDTREANELEPAEPAWVTVSLWLFPKPIVVFVASLTAAAAAIVCFSVATFLDEPVAWALSVLFGTVSLIIGLAGILRHRRRPRKVDWSSRRTTAELVVLLISCYSVMLSIALHVFQGFFAGIPNGNFKYRVTVSIAIASSLYMALHGRRFLRERIGTGRTPRFELSPMQVVVVLVIVFSLAGYFVWIMEG